MRELIEKRTATAKHYALEGGKRLGEFHIGHIHYQDGPLKDGPWQECDTELRLHAPTGTYRMTAAGYEAEIGPAGTVRFTNVDHSIEFLLPNKNKVEPVPSDNAWGRLGKGLIWRNLLQPGGHLEVQARNGSLAKIFHFDTKPESNEIEFEVKTGGQGQFRKGAQDQGNTWSLKGRQATFGATEDRLTFIRTPRAWNHRGESVDITLLFFVRGGKTYATKQIPQDFIDRTFNEPGAWLETDTTTSFYAGAGDGTPGRINVDETLSTIRAGAGNTVDTGTNVYPAGLIASSTSNKFARLYRSIFPFDTSSIGDTDIISAATFYVYANNYNEGLGADTNCIVGATPASNTALQNSDFGQLGSTEYSASRIDLKSTGYRSLALNATGIAAISKTSYTPIGLLSYWDLANSFGGTWADSLRSTLSILMSEQAGTDNDPKFTAVYVPAPLLVTPAAGSASTSKVDPTVVLGSINLTPAAGSAATSKIDPTVPEPSQWVTPAVAVAATSVAGPTVVYGSLTITPAIAEATTSKVDPTIILGSVQVTPTPGSAATEKGDPTLNWSSLTMTPAAGAAATAVAGPTVVLGSVTVTPAPGFAATSKVDPVVDLKLWRARWYNRGPGLLPGDIVMTQRRDYNVAGTGFDIYRAYGNVTAVGTDSVTGKEYADLYIAQGQEYFTDYTEDIEWVAVGNTINPARAAVIYMTADEEFSPRIEMRSGVDSFEKFGSRETLRVAIGNLSGIGHSNFGTLSGYGIFTDNGYFNGTVAVGSATSLSAGTGVWLDKDGNFRVGDMTANKFLRFTQSTGVFDFGSSVAFQWSQVGGAGKPADNATAGANWATNLAGIPIRFADSPTGAGLYITASYLGYYNNSVWTAYINNSGQWYFGGDGNNFVSWDGTYVTVKGNITMNGGSISWANVTAPGYSDITGTKPPYDADKTLTVIGANRLTYIDSGGIYTGTLTTSQLNAGAATVLGAVTAGSFNIGSGKFIVTSGGDVTMTSATITGSIVGSTITGSTLSTGAAGTAHADISSSGVILYSTYGAIANLYAYHSNFNIDAGSNTILITGNSLNFNGASVWTSSDGNVISAFGTPDNWGDNYTFDDAAQTTGVKLKLRTATIAGTTVHIVCTD